MTRITVIKPYIWTNAIDERGVVHRVVSLAGIMHLCTTRCGFDGRWSHVEDKRPRPAKDKPIDVVTWTAETPSCMTCIVREAQLAAA